MTASKNALQLFMQPLQNTRWYASPSTRLSTAIREAQQSSSHTGRASASRQTFFGQRSSRGITSAPTWTYRQQTRVPGVASRQVPRQRRQLSSTSLACSPSSRSSSSASPSSAKNEQLPTLAELEQQRTPTSSPPSQSIDVSTPKPEYLLQFTCKKCSERSTHKVSKQAYHGGTVLVQCPGCKVRHLVADHLGIFSDTRVTLEDIMAREGETIRKGKAELNFVPNGDGVIEVEKESQKPESK